MNEVHALARELKSAANLYLAFHGPGLQFGEDSPVAEALFFAVAQEMLKMHAEVEKLIAQFTILESRVAMLEGGRE